MNFLCAKQFLFCGCGFLVAGVHEGAGAALGAEIGIADGRAIFFGIETAGEQGVGFEAGRTAVELARMREDHAGAAMHGLNDAADLDLHVAVFVEFTDEVVIVPGADDGEAAVVVGGLGGADVEEAGAVGKLDYVIDMRRNANVFVEHFGGLVGGDAGFGRGEGGKGEQEEKAKEVARGHRCSFRERENGSAVLGAWEGYGGLGG